MARIPYWNASRRKEDTELLVVPYTGTQFQHLRQTAPEYVAGTQSADLVYADMDVEWSDVGRPDRENPWDMVRIDGILLPGICAVTVEAPREVVQHVVYHDLKGKNAPEVRILDDIVGEQNIDPESKTLITLMELKTEKDEKLRQAVLAGTLTGTYSDIAKELPKKVSITVRIHDKGQLADWTDLVARLWSVGGNVDRRPHTIEHPACTIENISRVILTNRTTPHPENDSIMVSLTFTEVAESRIVQQRETVDKTVPKGGSITGRVRPPDTKKSKVTRLPGTTIRGRVVGQPTQFEPITVRGRVP